MGIPVREVKQVVPLSGEFESDEAQLESLPLEDL